MNRLIRIATISMVLVILSALVLPIYAQDPAGGIIIEGQAGGDPTSLNPLISSDTTSARVEDFIYPDLVAVDPSTASFIQEGPGAIVNGWTISEDGLTYTFTLREDLFWSDGEQINADDVIGSWNVISDESEVSSLTFILDSIESVTKVDDFTIEVVMADNACDAIGDAIGVIPPYPSHIIPEDIATLPDQPENLNPTVTSNVYNFSEFSPAERISLVANQAYADAEMGYVNNDGWIYLSVPDLTVAVERFLAGELNVIDGPQEASREAIYAAADAGEVNIYTYPGNSWDYLAFNLADPTNPQNGMDDDGNLIDQGMHPIFGNTVEGRDVRYALNLALNIDEIIEGATFGEGTRMASHSVPSSWAYDDELEPVPYDPEMAAEILDEAGWPNSDPSDPTSIRVCDGCGTAEDGTELSFNLMTNEENGRRTAIITIAQDQWAQIGVQAEIETIEFFTMLDLMDAQEWDAYVLGWRNGYPDSPDMTQILTPAGDVIGSSSNAGSYANPEFIELNEKARSLPGCDLEERKELYHQMQAISQHDTPYIFMFVRNGFYATRSTVEGFDPYAEQLYWNVDTWSVRSAD